MIRILNFLRICRGVYLLDYRGQISESIAIKNPFGGGYLCYVYPFSKVGCCIMLLGGEVGGDPIYIKKWTWMTKNNLVDETLNDLGIKIKPRIGNNGE